MTDDEMMQLPLAVKRMTEHFARAGADAEARLAILMDSLPAALKRSMIVNSPPVEITPLGPLTTSKPCEIHKTHVPKSHVNHLHHVWPLGDKGPNVAENRVVVCPTGHYNIHALLDRYREYNGTPPKFLMRGFPAKERELAALGWDRITRGAL